MILGEEKAWLPPHDLILRPVLQYAESAVVIGAPADSVVIREAAPILSGERGRLVLSICEEVVHGYESLWNAGGGRRGTIAIKSRISEERLAALFGLCGDAWKWAPKSERSAFGATALRYALSEVSVGCRVFLLSRTNGIQWLGVYSTSMESVRLFAEAQRMCKPFKRWFEVSDPENYNIIGQYHIGT